MIFLQEIMSISGNQYFWQFSKKALCKLRMRAYLWSLGLPESSFFPSCLYKRASIMEVWKSRERSKESLTTQKGWEKRKSEKSPPNPKKQTFLSVLETKLVRKEQSHLQNSPVGFGFSVLRGKMHFGSCIPPCFPGHCTLWLQVHQTTFPKRHFGDVAYISGRNWMGSVSLLMKAAARNKSSGGWKLG